MNIQIGPGEILVEISKSNETFYYWPDVDTKMGTAFNRVQYWLRRVFSLAIARLHCNNIPPHIFERFVYPG